MTTILVPIEFVIMTVLLAALAGAAIMYVPFFILKKMQRLEPVTVAEIAKVQRAIDEVREHPQKYPVFSMLEDYQVMGRISRINELKHYYSDVLDQDQLAEVETLKSTLGY